MALFSFLKKKQKEEKHAHKHEAKEMVEHEHHDHAREAEPKIAARFEGVGHTVLIAPQITERARALSEIGHYVFRINSAANKQEVKKAVESAYGVHVDHVQIVMAHEKPRRRGLTEGVKRGYKKAVVALRKGEAIDIF